MLLLVLMLLAESSAFTNSLMFSEQKPTETSGGFLLIGGTHQDLSTNFRELFFEMAGGQKARIVVIPTGVAHADKPESSDEFLKTWLALKPQSVVVLHTRDRKVADDPEFVKPLTGATAVFVTNGHRDRIFNAYRSTRVEKELKKLHLRGGLIGGTGTGAVVLGDLAIIRANEDGGTEQALGLLSKFLVEDREDGEQFAGAIAANPTNVGLFIGPGSAVSIRGNDLRMIGEGVVAVRLAKGIGKGAKVELLKSGDMRDIEEFRRAAANRAGRGR